MNSNPVASSTSAKTAALLKVFGVLALAIAVVFAISGCTTQKEGYSGGVAATVNGVEIPEDKVTDQVQENRAAMGLDDEESWGQWLVQYGFTPQTFRDRIVEQLVNEELIKQGAKDAGVTVESSEIDGYVNQMKSNYDSDDAWQAALKAAGMSEEEYRSALETSILASKFQDSLASDSMTDEEKLAYAQENLGTYDGARKSSHILFSADDEATAQQVLDQINSGQLDFAAAAEQYSQDTGSASQGGDVGWDKLTTFVDEYQTALDGLEPGQISGLVPSQFGIHIIQCTDKFTMPAELTSLDQVPAELLAQIETTMTSTNKQEAYQKWLEEQKNGDGVVINDMPSGLIYDIDLTPYQDAADAAAAESADAEASADAAAESENGSGEGAEGEQG